MSVNDYEKQQYVVNVDSPSDHGLKELADQKGDNIAEAANIYGSVEKAESYGYVQRGLKSRHIQFIALGGTIGTGLFLGIDGAFANAGPVSVLLGYTITGLYVFAMMQCLGEMATWFPLPGAIPQFVPVTPTLLLVSPWVGTHGTKTPSLCMQRSLQPPYL
jgi:amino acid transporter